MYTFRMMWWGGRFDEEDPTLDLTVVLMVEKLFPQPEGWRVVALSCLCGNDMDRIYIPRCRNPGDILAWKLRHEKCEEKIRDEWPMRRQK